MTCLRVLSASILAAFFSLNAGAQERYPQHLPEWIWADDQRYQLLTEDAERSRFRDRMRLVAQLKSEQKEMEAQDVFLEATRRLHANFAVRDLVRGAPVVPSASGNAHAAILLDPKFPPEMIDVLSTAIGLVLEHGTNDIIVEKAMSQSSNAPQPFPTEADGALFRNMAQSIVRPKSAAAFISDLRSAIGGSLNQPALIVVSSYSGNVWWGGGFYDSYRSPDFTLTRLGNEGYLYIRLNTDRMTEGSTRVHDPNFWAGKIAHELLHNLGYWHPPYTDPANRDQMNPDGQKAFLYAYAVALTEFLDTLP